MIILLTKEQTGFNEISNGVNFQTNIAGMSYFLKHFEEILVEV